MLTFRGPYLCMSMNEMTFNRHKQISESIEDATQKTIQPLKKQLKQTNVNSVKASY